MSDDESGTPAHFIASFNADLEALGSAARVALRANGEIADHIELRDDEENFLAVIPASAEPEMVAIAYRLYGRGLNIGVRTGETAAWAKLRFLIGAAAADADRCEFGSTTQQLVRPLEKYASHVLAGKDPWGDDPAHPLSDWRSEVANDDTRLGYLAWKAARRETSEPAGPTD